MERLDSVQTATAGFRVIQKHPWVIPIWAAVYLLISVAALGAAMPIILDAISSMFDLVENDVARPDPALVLGIFAKLAPLIALGVLASLVLGAIFGAAVNRSVLRPQEFRFGYLRLGMAELRQLVVSVAFSLLYFVVSLVAIVVIGAIAAFVPDGAALLVVVLCLAALAGALYLAVRFSVAPAQTFDEGRINLVGSWSLTRGSFWPLLGAYCLAIALVLGVSLALSIAGSVIGGLAGGSPEMMMREMIEGDQKVTPEELRKFLSLETFLTLGVVLSVAISSVSQALAMLIFGVTPPTAYQHLASKDIEPASAEN